jgi:CHAT domain-containing protein
MWWLPLSEMQVRRTKIEAAGSQSGSSLAPGDPVHVLEVSKTRARVVAANSGDDQGQWVDLDNLEPRGSCLPDPKTQLNYYLMHSGLISFIEPNRDSGTSSPSRYHGAEGHFTHTFNTLIAALRRYDDKTAALLYYYGASNTCIFLISKNGIEQYTITPANRGRLEALADDYNRTLVAEDAVRSRMPQTDVVAHRREALAKPKSAYEIHETLLPSSIRQKLEAYDKLIIVPYGVVSLIPFAALRLDSKHTLIDRLTYTIAPSLTWLGIAPGLHTQFRANERSPAAIVLGNPAYKDRRWTFPNLPGAETEAKAVAKVFNVRPLLGQDARLNKLQQLLGNQEQQQVDVLYLASHGVADTRPAAVSESFVALAAGDRLNDSTLGQIGYRGSRLVVLSACQTGVGWTDEVGSIGLQRTFRSYGAHEIVMSLWSIDDAATADIMIEFAKQYKEHWPNSSAAVSLRHAVLKAKQKYPDPEYWGAFAVYGVGPF